MAHWLSELEPENRATVVKEAFAKVAATPEGNVVFTVLAELGKVFDHDFIEKEDGTLNLDLLNERRVRRNFVLEVFDNYLPNRIERARAALYGMERE